MDKFVLKEMDPDPQIHSPFWIRFRVYINDRLILEDDYTLDIASFFKALTYQESVIEFVGGCGYPSCCGEGRHAKIEKDFWKWLDFAENGFIEYRIPWIDIYFAANQLIEKIEHLPPGNYEYERYYDQIPVFRKNLENLKNEIDGSIPEFENEPGIWDIEQVKNFYLHKPQSFDSTLSSIEEDVKCADTVFCLHSDGRVALGFKTGTDNKSVPILFTQTEIFYFLFNEQKKNLLVVCYPELFTSEILVSPPVQQLGYQKIQFCRGNAELAFKLRTESASRVRPSFEQEQIRRYVKFSPSENKYDIGFGHGLLWNPYIKIDESEYSPRYFSEQELLSFLHQDTQRNVLNICIPDEYRSDNESLTRMIERSGFSHAEIGKQSDTKFLPKNGALKLQRD